MWQTLGQLDERKYEGKRLSTTKSTNIYNTPYKNYAKIQPRPEVKPHEKNTIDSHGMYTSNSLSIVSVT